MHILYFSPSLAKLHFLRTQGFPTAPQLPVADARSSSNATTFEHVCSVTQDAIDLRTPWQLHVKTTWNIYFPVCSISNGIGSPLNTLRWPPFTSQNSWSCSRFSCSSVSSGNFVVDQRRLAWKNHVVSSPEACALRKAPSSRRPITLYASDTSQPSSRSAFMPSKIAMRMSGNCSHPQKITPNDFRARIDRSANVYVSASSTCLFLSHKTSCKHHAPCQGGRSLYNLVFCLVSAHLSWIQTTAKNLCTPGRGEHYYIDCAWVNWPLVGLQRGEN